MLTCANESSDLARATADVTAPRAITKLATDVVNRIAAGEIIQRPANALKELLENALDARSTRIVVTVKEGGLKLLQIQDNGSGIRRADLPILCERFTTSKIKEFGDLNSLGTYGFRGEALASISHVAHLSVTTKTRQETCAWKAAYSDGVMIPIKAGAKEVQPVPVAGNDGTIISVEDLFYNTPSRLKALRSASDEYSRIVSVVLQYAIHNAGVSMVCKKAGSNSADVNTQLGTSVLDNIGLMYGEQVKRELIEVSLESQEYGMKAIGYFSNATYGAKKGTYLFFINHRLVDCSSMKRALEAFYSVLLAKNAHPFVYLSLEIEPSRVDVNVHPTKREVGFEDQDEIVELLCQHLAVKLEKTSATKSYQVQTLLPTARQTTEGSQKIRSKSARRVEDREPVEDDEDEAVETHQAHSSQSMVAPITIRKTAPKSMVRTDHATRTLDSMFMPLASKRPMLSKKQASEPEALPKVHQDNSSSDKVAVERTPTQLTSPKKQPLLRIKIPQSESALTSIKELRRDVIRNKDDEMDALFKNHVFVGVVDVAQSLSMLQYRTGLYMFNHGLVSEELFYQLALRQFGKLARMRLKPALSISELVQLAVANEPERGVTKMTDEQIIQRVLTTLLEAREMLDEYFSLSITNEGNLESLPNVLPGYVPDLKKLPICTCYCHILALSIKIDESFPFPMTATVLLRLAVNVDWQNEKPCFDSFMRELAKFYNPIPFKDLIVRFARPKVTGNASVVPDSQEVAQHDQSAVVAEEVEEGLAAQDEADRDKVKHSIEHVVVPAVRQYLVVPTKMRETRGGVTRLTTLESLYKV
ncbi:DNA mismatch repair protein Mlh1 [Microbotryomycetes sp. JL201]|nr:DNA mismatch repair protein Mlh1 [Microbotryomycetes sp. JL201]